MGILGIGFLSSSGSSPDKYNVHKFSLGIGLGIRNLAAERAGK